MKKLFLSGCLLLVLGFSFSPAQAKPKPKTGASASSDIALLKAIPPKARLSQIQRLLGRNVRIADKTDFAMITEGPIGNWVEFKGSKTVTAYFLSPIQKRALREYGSDTTRKTAELKFRATDPVNVVYLMMGNGVTSNKKDAFQRLKELKKLLGRPVWERYDGMDFYAGGYGAEWKLSGGRKIDFTGENQLFGGTYSVLTLTFPNSTLG